MIRFIAILAFMAGPAAAEAVVAARTIPARTIIAPEDLLLRDVTVLGGLEDPALAIGQESRVALYAGLPISARHPLLNAIKS